MYYDVLSGHKSPRGADYRVNMLPTTCHVYFGKVTGATPDGRNAWKVLSEGISPVQGADTNGPTAVIRSAAKIDHIKTGGTLLNQKFTPSLLSTEEGCNNLVHLIRAYFRMEDVYKRQWLARYRNLCSEVGVYWPIGKRG